MVRNGKTFTKYFGLHSIMFLFNGIGDTGHHDVAGLGAVDENIQHHRLHQIHRVR